MNCKNCPSFSEPLGLTALTSAGGRSVGRSVGWMDGWVNGRVGGWMDGWMNRWMNRWMDGFMNEWMDGWMDGWIHTYQHKGKQRTRQLDHSTHALPSTQSARTIVHATAKSTRTKNTIQPHIGRTIDLPFCKLTPHGAPHHLQVRRRHRPSSITIEKHERVLEQSGFLRCERHRTCSAFFFFFSFFLVFFFFFVKLPRLTAKPPPR